MSHWYYPNGLPCTEVLKKDGKGTKKPTIREAREMGLVPSVTTILQVIHNTGLEIWKTNQIIEFAWKVDRKGIAYVDWADRVREMATTESELAADTGSDIHEAITEWIKTGKMDTNYARWVDSFSKWWLPFLAENLVNSNDVFCEEHIKTINGYGGRYDIKIATAKIMIDIKTQNSKDKPLKTYRNWGRQLKGYGDVEDCNRLINFIIDSQNPEKFSVYEWPITEHLKLSEEFKAAKTLWCSENDLTPKAITKEVL